MNKLKHILIQLQLKYDHGHVFNELSVHTFGLLLTNMLKILAGSNNTIDKIKDDEIQCYVISVTISS
jgi:hypothetical protein